MLKARYQDQPIGLLDREWFTGGQNGMLSEWKKKIILWNSLLGIRDNLPDEVQEPMLLDFLRNEYGGLTFSELELAFRMNLLGEFGDIIQHFNMLNVRFLTQIVNAYKLHRVEIDNKYKQICHKLQYLPAPVQDDQQADYHCGRHTYLKYKQWLSGQPAIALFGDYNFLLRIGILSDSQSVMDDALNAVEQGFTDEIEASVSDTKRIGAILGNDSLLTAEISERAKSYIVINLFEKLKADGTDFQSLIREHIHATHRERATQGEG